jgi:uncharacterized RDD family membrane protein YckC
MNKYSTFWKRFAAAIIDSIVLWPLTLINGYVDGSANKFIFIIGSLLFLTIYSAYFIILQGRYGQTVGKKIMSIKVIDINEVSLIGIKRAILRELPWIIADISILLYFFMMLFLIHHSNLEKAKDSYKNLIFITSFTWMLIELATMLTNYKRRAVHDYLAKSVVIKTDN